MSRTKLALASVAVAAIACAIVLAMLREPAAPAAVGAPPPGEAIVAETTRAPEPGAGPSASAAEGDRDRVLEAAAVAEAEEQMLRDEILAIGDDPSLAFDARLDRYRETLQAARERHPDAPLLAHPTMLAELFFRMDGVQRELGAMPPSARRNALAHVRRVLGFDEAQIARWEEIDAKREARWEVGLAYMEERTRVAVTFEGDALDAELRALREAFFGDVAKTIEAEERDGFFRFERERIYGRN